MFVTSRRGFIRQATITTAIAGAIGPGAQWLATPAEAAVTSAKVGCITGNDPAGFLRFSSFFNKKPTFALLAFNQASPTALWGSVPYICAQGVAFALAGAKVLWSVPCPGPRQLEAIVAGTWDSQYKALFAAIVAASPNDASSIIVRLPWEFNLAGQDNAAMDKNGKFNAALFVKAFQHLATMARNASPRVQRLWCPNVTTMQLDPLACWPGPNCVDIVGQDFYMQSAWNKPGDFSWFLNEPRGLLWGVNFARSNGKLYGLSEWGMDSDAFVGDLNSTALWMAGLGTELHHQCWWDRADVIDCRIADGTHPKLAAAYRKQFG